MRPFIADCGDHRLHGSVNGCRRVAELLDLGDDLRDLFF